MSWRHPTPALPIYSPISGRYQDVLFSVVEASLIHQKSEESPALFSDEMKAITEYSNPVVVFYHLSDPERETEVVEKMVL